MSAARFDSEPLVNLRARLNEVRAADWNRLRKRLHGLEKKARSGKALGRALEAVENAIQASIDACEQRRTNLPTLNFPPDLPICERRDEITTTIRDHQAIIVCGETGSGKTTQLPKLALAAGQGVRGLIGHTQPRRLAARSVATRIAQEMNTPLGGAAGYKVRFSEKLSAQSYVKVMTDGILLAETQGSPTLSAYDTLIIDEAHERSLNIDFLLGYLKRLLPRRPDLKLIVTSATIDPQRFSAHFNDAPILEVSGRTYPMELRYRPLMDDDGEADMIGGIVDAVQELDHTWRGDILIFLPGERDIRETAEALRRERLLNTEILPLYARLGARSQQLVFQQHNARRIVLATNVAETSLTVPGIRYVIDPGLARTKRYSQRTKATRLPIEPVSQASADQRAGRCGRTAPGICVRLYSEDDYLQRPRFTQPEIQRTSLASVILQMKSLGLGDIRKFPFIDPPKARLINDGLRSLYDLHALDEEDALTALGSDLARLPLEPQLGRMILAADERNALHEVLIIVAALSVQDPRERPADKQQAADQKHARFNDPRSEFLAFVNLWDWQKQQRHNTTRREFRTLCQAHYLSSIRLREWQDVHKELLALAHELKLTINRKPAEYANIHQALLTGLLNQIGNKQEAGEYLGPRGVHFRIHPGSALFKKGPRWLMAGELVETKRLYARNVARVEAPWLERAGAHLLKRTYLDPHWEKKPAQVTAFAQISLYGLILTRGRRMHYGAVDPVLSREMFIRAALVDGDYDSPGTFLQHNRRRLAELEEEEAKVRRRGIVADDEALFRFYDQRIPTTICRGVEFEKWRKKVERDQPRLLYLTREDLLENPAGLGSAADYPERITSNGVPLALEYQFEPGTDADGVTAIVPLAALNQLQPAPFEWLVPGLLEEKITALIKSLPKRLRRNVVPAPDFAHAAFEAIGFQREETLTEELAHALTRMTDVPISAQDFDPEHLPLHLKMRFRVVDESGETFTAKRSLQALRRTLTERAQKAFAHKAPAQASPWERDDITEWDFGPLPEHVTVERAGARLPAYPALVTADDSLNLRLFDSPRAAHTAMLAGLRRLFAMQLGRHMRHVEKKLPHLQQMSLYFVPVGNAAVLKADLVNAALDHVFMQPPLPRDQVTFRQRLEAGRTELVPRATEIADITYASLAEYNTLMKILSGNLSPALLHTAQDIQEQVNRLIYPGFISATPPRWRARLPVYLKAARLRLEETGMDPTRNRHNQAAVQRWWKRFEQLGGEQEAENDPALMQLRWMIEEYRVSLFAQKLGTALRVSDKRLERAAAQAAGA